MSQTKVLLEGLGFPESPRWRDGHVWVCNWGAGEVLAVTSGGARETVARIAAHTIPFSIDWLPDGRMLVIGGYLAWKAAILGYTPAAALESTKRGSRLSCVCPVTHDTAMSRGNEITDREARIAMLPQPLGRLGAPLELTALVHFLFSRNCGFITGQAIATDGGESAGLMAWR